MTRRGACAVVVVVFAVPALISGTQRPAENVAAAFRTLRGQVVADDQNGTPLRRVRIVLTGNNIASTPSYSDEQGLFEIAVPQSAAYTLTFTKAGFAPQDVQRAASTPATDLQIKLARGAAVTGRVVDQFGDPLVARVTVRRVTDDTGRSVAATESIVDSDDLGEFRAGSLPAGRYEVAVDLRNPSMPPPPPEAAQARDALRPPTTVQLRAGEEASLSLVEEAQPTDPRGRVIGGSRTPVVENGAAIRGRVLGVDSRPVGGAFIMLFAGVEGARQTDSAADGVYEFAGLPPGTYRINAGKIGASLSMVDRNLDVTIREGQIADGVTIVLRKPAAVVGTVLDEYGEPVEGVNVELLQSFRGGGRSLLERPPDVRPRRTDDRGRYRLFPIGPGEHYVLAGEEPRVVRGAAQRPESSQRVYYPGTPAVSDALPVRVVAGQDTLGVNIEYALVAGARVYGYAFDAAGEPLTSPVTLVESFRSAGPMMARRQALVREDGTFAFLNVSPGDYVVQGVLRPAPGRSSELGIEFVSVTGQDVPLVTLRTSGGTTVKGRVELEGDTSKVQFDAFGVGASPSDLDYAPIGIDPPGAGIRDDGTFELHVQGPMRITSRAAPEGWWLKSAMIGAVDVADQPYTFTARGDAPVDVLVVFSDAVTEISGRVADARGRPARDSFVLVFPADQSRWYIASRYMKLARPAADGSFRIVSLPPGDYWIVAIDQFDVATEWQDSDVLQTLAPSAQRITVAERQRVFRDLPLVERALPR